MERYKGIKRHEVPPHVFAITDSAYRSMLQGLYFTIYSLLNPEHSKAAALPRDYGGDVVMAMMTADSSVERRRSNETKTKELIMPSGRCNFKCNLPQTMQRRCMQIAKMKWEKYARQTKQTRHELNMMNSACSDTMQPIQYRTAYGDELSLSFSHFIFNSLFHARQWEGWRRLKRKHKANAESLQPALVSMMIIIMAKQMGDGIV